MGFLSAYGGACRNELADFDSAIPRFESWRPSHTGVRNCSRSSVFVRQLFEIAAEIFLLHSHIFVDDRLQPEKLTVSMTVSRADTVSKIDAEIPSCI
jgi:hypothetical protein